MPRFPHSLSRLLPAFLLMGTLTILTPGCNKSATQEDPEESSTEEGVEKPGETPSRTVASNNQENPKGVWTTPGGQKMLGNVPYDVFVNTPVQIAQNGTPTGTNTPANPNQTPTNPNPE